jgi:wyosine [tRNA(Phe)-imidazoG37] synthetase (radical SAM superfamily)
MELFGPVPSRRLGRSVGVNHIPPKACSYGCVYCQVGRTDPMTIRPADFPQNASGPEAIGSFLGEIEAREEPVDYVSFVPDGEPTLDARLGDWVDLIHDRRYRVAIITNGTLLDTYDVRATLARADWVSVKVDAGDEATWKRVNRPHRALRFTSILDGVYRMREQMRGVFVTETMLVEGINDGDGSVDSIAPVLSRINPDTAWISVPTRPPSESGVHPADPSRVRAIAERFRSAGIAASALARSEGDVFGAGGDSRSDVLSITAVHPMRHAAVEHVLRTNGDDWTVIDRMLTCGELLRRDYGEDVFYMRALTVRDRDRSGGSSELEAKERRQTSESEETRAK